MEREGIRLHKVSQLPSAGRESCEPVPPSFSTQGAVCWEKFSEKPFLPPMLVLRNPSNIMFSLK